MNRSNYGDLERIVVEEQTEEAGKRLIEDITGEVRIAEIPKLNKAYPAPDVQAMNLNSRYPTRQPDRDTEYKIIRAVDSEMQCIAEDHQKGTLKIYIRLSPCKICQDNIKRFQERHPNITVQIKYDIQYDNASAPVVARSKILPTRGGRGGYKTA